MALIKSVETPQGVTTLYHRVVKAEMQMDAQLIEVVVAAYTSPEARDGGKVPVWHEYIRVPFSALTMDPRTAIYPLIALYGQSLLKGATGDATATPGDVGYELCLKAEAMQPEPGAPADQTPPPAGSSGVASSLPDSGRACWQIAWIVEEAATAFARKTSDICVDRSAVPICAGGARLAQQQKVRNKPRSAAKLNRV